jgi:hypothetical protein
MTHSMSCGQIEPLTDKVMTALGADGGNHGKIPWGNPWEFYVGIIQNQA